MFLNRFFLFITATMLVYLIGLNQLQSALAQGASVLEIEIKRLPRTETQAEKLAAITKESRTAPPSSLKFADGQPFINNFFGQSPLIFETRLDEVDMPSQLLDDCLRAAVCVPYASLKPLHLLNSGTVIMTSPSNAVLNFYSGTIDRFSIGDKWFSYSSGPSPEIVQMIHNAAHIGADQSTLLKNFHIDGGLCPTSYQRYCLNDKIVNGRAVKVNVEFANHKIKRCSPPYIEQAFFD